MCAALVEIIGSFAPEAAKIVENLQKQKLNTNQILMSLLALNLDQSKKSDCILREVKYNAQIIRDLKSDMARKGTI